MAHQSTSYRQLRVVKEGAPFELHQVSTSEPEGNEIQVKVKATSLNTVDAKKTITGLATPLWPSWPIVVGLEAAGIVESVGQSVKEFKPGDEVLGLFGIDGQRSAAFQEYATVTSASIATKPTSWSFEDASTLPIAFATAAAALHHSMGIALPFLQDSLAKTYQPKSLLVISGSSSMGAAAIQMARIALPDTIILTTAVPSHHQHVLSLGASQVFDRTAPDVVSQILAGSPSGAGVEAVFDPVGLATTQREYLSLLTGDKKIFTQLQTDKNLAKSDVPTGVDFRVTNMSDLSSAPGGGNIMKALGDLLARGEWKLPAKPTVIGHGLENIEGGLRKLIAGVLGTKMVVTL